MNNRKIIFRIFYTMIILLPLIPIIYAKMYDIPYIEIPSFIFYSAHIVLGLMSYRKDMLNLLKKDSGYIENIKTIAFPLFIRFLLYLIIVFVFVYLEYYIFGFFYMLSFFGEYTLEKRVLNQNKN